jgi:PAP2 superfamily
MLWASDDADRFRTGAAAAGLHNAVAVAAISRQLGGEVARPMNDWLAANPVPATAAAWFYVVMNGAIAGLVGLAMIRRRVPTFPLHRDALIACNLIALVVFYLYPVAPPRMLPGYHDITGAAVPVFSSMLEGRAADEFASLPSLHVTWALWVAVAASTLVRRPVWRAALWLYPAATIADVLATANHYLLDVILAPAVLLLAYAIAAALILARRHQVWPPPLVADLARLPAAVTAGLPRRAAARRLGRLAAALHLARKPAADGPAPDGARAGRERGSPPRSPP